jgi:hypothetical protein
MNMARHVTMFFMLALMSSVVFGAGPLDRFLGKHAGYSRACWNSHLILTRKRVSLDECRDRPFTILQKGEKNVSIELEQDHSCEFSIITFGLENDSNYKEYINIHGFKNKSNFEKNQHSLYCLFYREKP